MASPSTPPEASGSKGRAFPSTHWSIVLQARAGDERESAAALERLCRRYWYPIYGYVRRRGRTHHEAEDMAQSFFAHLLAHEGIARARPDRGRFRAFLLTALRNFMTNEWSRGRAARRGGGVTVISLEWSAADERFSRETPDEAMTPERLFDRSWALGVIDQALGALRAEYAGSGRGPLFDALAPLVWGGQPTQAPSTQARAIGLNEGAFKVALHRFRKRLRERLREEVLSTVADESEIEVELRHLITSVSGRAT